MKRYKVVAPVLVFAIKEGTGKKEQTLLKGDVAELPEDDINVRAMLSRKQIVEAGEEKATKAAKK